MDFGIVDLKIPNQSSKKERFPVNAGMQIGYVRDRWIGVRGLIDPQFFQIKGKPNRVEIKFFDADGVPLKPSVHIPLNLPTQGFVDEISEDKDNY
jgi:hypothetical protein